MSGRDRAVRYDEGCLAANALNVVGDRWALLVVRELLLTSKRFRQIRAGLPGVTASVLSTRLAQLGEQGIVTHDPATGGYALTALGRTLRPVILALARFGAGHPDHDPRRFISPTSLMLSMTIMVDPPARRRPRLVGGFDLGTERFLQRLGGSRASDPLTVEVVADPAELDAAEFVLVGTGNSLAVAVYGPLPLADLMETGALVVRGDVVAAQSYVDRFRLPGPVSG